MLKDDMYKLVMLPGEEIIDVLPQEFIVDSEQGIKDPVGMAGIRLEPNFHIITGQVAAAKNIEKCVRKADLSVVELILEPLASAEAVLSAEEKQAGVVLVDIGGGTTAIACLKTNRKYIGYEINPAYHAIIHERIYELDHPSLPQKKKKPKV